MYCDKILKILKEDVLTDSAVIDIDTNLFETGLMDSLATMHLFIQLEENFGIHLDLAEIEIEDFSTVRKINEYILNNR